MQSNNHTDAGVLTIDSPDSGVLSNNENISITVRNYGVLGVSNIEVYYQINGGNPISEILPGAIISGQSVEYTFETIEAMSKSNISLKLSLFISSISTPIP